MSDKKAFYITTTIAYVNADPHIGFALELIQADVLARYQRLIGNDVFFSTGTDEYGQKIWEASQEENLGVQEYVDKYSEIYSNLKNLLNLSNDNFIRTTSPENIKAAQEFWTLCEKRGDIYKKEYEGMYCVGCEKFLNERDLEEGRCVFHPNKTLEIVKEENYFFKLSNYKNQLIDYLNGDVALPVWRKKEALDYIQNAMDDFSISRSKERISWGIPIPGDNTQVMYVWFGAFVNYISTLGWPGETELFKKFWQDGYTVQVAGKDMVKFQSVMWQGMLMSAGLFQTDKVIYHGFITGEGGSRMSKSTGNVINPKDIVDKYGTDALRYFLLREISTFEDSPFTRDRFAEVYNANLVNGLGNLVSRIMKLAEDNLNEKNNWDNHGYGYEIGYFGEKMSEYRLDLATDYVWAKIAELDKEIQDKKPWESKDQEVIKNLVLNLYRIGCMLKPFMPNTAEKIIDATKENKKPENLFPRIEAVS